MTAVPSRRSVFYLEHREPRLKGLVQTGINEQGKPVPYPVDSLRIIQVAGGVELVMMAASTTDEGELSRKWLGKHPPRKEAPAQKPAQEGGH